MGYEIVEEGDRKEKRRIRIKRKGEEKRRRSRK